MEIKGIEEQIFLNDLDNKLWNAADKRREQLKANFANPEESIGNMFSKGFFP